MGLALGLSLTVCAVGTGLASLAGQPRFTILAITLIAIAVANLARRQMQALKGDFTLGMLLLYVFSACSAPASTWCPCCARRRC